MKSISVRGSREYRDWVARFAEDQRTNVSILVDSALVGHAKATGFYPPPAR